MKRKVAVALPLTQNQDIEERPLRVALEEAERKHILSILQRTKGNRIRAARILGISRKTLWKKLKQLGIGTPFDVTQR
jgi:DNA-binding NtrC family response regulator